MCYKYMWDNLAADNFPSTQFYDFFSLDRDYVLSEDIIEITANAGFPAKVEILSLNFFFLLRDLLCYL